MTFSIAIPVHNGEKYLKATLVSALSQRRPADEIVVVDDASTDQSANILQSPEWRTRVHYIYNEKSSGFVDAWNRVVTYTHSDYVTILHQDDLLDPDYLYSIEQGLTTYPNCQHIYSGYYYIDERDIRVGVSPTPHTRTPKVIPGKEYTHRYLNGVIHNRHIHRCPGVTTKRMLLLEKCSYRKEAGLIADDDFFLRVGQFTDVIEISQPLASFRQHKQSATAQLESLSHRLAEDYVYQTRHYRTHVSILLEPDICLIQDQAVRFINAYFIESFLKNSSSSIRETKKLRLQFENLAVGYFKKKSPVVHRLLWQIVEKVQLDSVAMLLISVSLRMLFYVKKRLSY
jgi:glycosyltransferase involved in cell wall biosynthesis